MKWLLVIWLLCAGLGLSYSVILERKKQISLLHTMEHSLKQVAYYMYQWRMPVEEVIKQMIKEKNQLTYFYETILKEIEEKKVGDLGELWYEESCRFLEHEKLADNIKILWRDCFLHMPMEMEAIQQSLMLKCEAIFNKRKELEERYKGEQRLVLTMGFFTSAFLCLILW